MSTPDRSSPEFFAWLDGIETSGLEKIARLEAEISRERQRVEAARVLKRSKAVSDEPEDALPSHRTPITVAEVKTWPQLVNSILDGEERGLRVSEIVTKMGDGEWKVKYRRQPNNLYNTLGRLTRSGVIRREGKRYFHFTVNGVPVEDVEPRSFHSEVGGIPHFISRLIAERGPLPPGEIVSSVRSEPSLAPRLAKNPDLPYTHLSKMVRTGRLQRVDGVYHLPPHEVAQQATLFSNGEGRPM